MTVKELMKADVATCAPESDLGAVVTIMRDRDCGFLPVVDSHGIVVGAVTDRRRHRRGAEGDVRASRCRGRDLVTGWNARAAVASGYDIKGGHLRTFDVPAYSSEMARRASTRLDRWALARIQSTVTSAPIRFMLWDGFAMPSTAPAIATILFKNRPALLSWVWDPDLNFGEAYMSGAVEVRGDLLTVLEAIYRALAVQKPRPWWLWQTSNTARAARENVHHHYDLSRRMVISTAVLDALLKAAEE